MFKHYENKNQKLAPLHVFYGRMLRNLAVACTLLAICLLIGIFGYHYTADIPWIDAVHNASMILSGMGPVADVKPFWGKIFSSAYALFSGVAFITNIGIILAPMAHRLFTGCTWWKMVRNKCNEGNGGCLTRLKRSLFLL